MLGTNPIAIAAPPGGEGIMPSLDMATSVVAFSHVIRAARAGTPIPSDWAIGPDGRLFIAVHLDSLRDRPDYEESLDRLIAGVHGAATAPWANELLFPGELEHRAAAERAAGIPIRPEVLTMLRELGQEYGLAFPI